MNDRFYRHWRVGVGTQPPAAWPSGHGGNYQGRGAVRLRLGEARRTTPLDVGNFDDDRTAAAFDVTSTTLVRRTTAAGGSAWPWRPSLLAEAPPVTPTERMTQARRRRVASRRANVLSCKFASEITVEESAR